MIRRFAFIIAVALVMGFTLFNASPASAHGYIVRAIPEDRAVLERAPLRVQYWFSESLEPAFSSMIVRDASGSEIASGGVDERDGRLLAARLPIGLPDGAYTVDLRVAFASDGHVIADRRAFFVGEAVAFAGVEAQTTAVPLEVVWRVLVLVGTTLLFGIYGTYALVFVPAWGSRAHPAGGLPPRVMRRIHWIAGIALGIAFAGNILALLQQSMVFFGADIGRVLSENLWSVVRTSTRFGDTWNARMALLALIAALHGAALYFRREQPALVRPFLTANLWAMPMLVGTWSISAHAAGSLVLPWAALISDWLHGIGVGLWAGGVAALALILPVAAQPYTDPTARSEVIRTAIRRFSPVALACVAVIVATGIYNTSNWIERPAEVGTPYGVTLILKLVLIAPLFVLGWMNKPQPSTPSPNGERESARLRAGRGVKLESVAAIWVLIAAAWLSATPTPQPELVGRDQPAPSAAMRLSGTIDLSATIAPGGPGVNTIDLTLMENGQPINDADVQIRAIYPVLDVRGTLQDAESIGEGVYTTTVADFDRAGAWWLIVQVTTDGITQQTAAAFDIRADAAIALTRDPSLINLIALTGVILALGWAALPSLRRFVRWLDWRPAAVVTAGASILAGIAVVIFGVIASNNAAAQLDAELNPPPALVNPVLPDAASLARGQNAYETMCEWTGGTVDELIRRLERTRDETLYDAVLNGWRDLPACVTDDVMTRWEIVNWIRWGLEQD